MHQKFTKAELPANNEYPNEKFFNYDTIKLKNI